MNTITVKLPTIDEVEFSLIAHPEEIPVRGNAAASGDDDCDKEIEDGIIQQIENGNVWAWACVEVKATWKGLEESEYLGCCSYKDEDEFKADGYYQDMRERVYDLLITEIKSLAMSKTFETEVEGIMYKVDVNHPQQTVSISECTVNGQTLTFSSANYIRIGNELGFDSLEQVNETRLATYLSRYF